MHGLYLQAMTLQEGSLQLLAFEISSINPKVSTTECEWHNGRYIRFCLT